MSSSVNYLSAIKMFEINLNCQRWYEHHRVHLEYVGFFFFPFKSNQVGLSSLIGGLPVSLRLLRLGWFILMRSNWTDWILNMKLLCASLFSLCIVLRVAARVICFAPPTQAAEEQAEENGLQISSAFSLNPNTAPGRPTASFNPGRGSGPVGQLAQNGDTGTHNRAGKRFHHAA